MKRMKQIQKYFKEKVDKIKADIRKLESEKWIL